MRTIRVTTTISIAITTVIVVVVMVVVLVVVVLRGQKLIMGIFSNSSQTIPSMMLVVLTLCAVLGHFLFCHLGVLLIGSFVAVGQSLL